MARAAQAKRRRETGAKVIARRYERVAGGGERAGHIISSAITDYRQATRCQLPDHLHGHLSSQTEKSGQFFSHTILTAQLERPDRLHIQDGDAYTVSVGLEPQLGRLDRTASNRTTTTTFIASAITRTNTIDLTLCRTSLPPRRTLLTSNPTWNSHPTLFSLVLIYLSRNIHSRRRPYRPCLRLGL
jgi:hypothetical protein